MSFETLWDSLSRFAGPGRTLRHYGKAARGHAVAVATMDTIRKQVDQRAALIGAPSDYLPTYGRSEQTGRPHIEVSRDGPMEYVVAERGSEFERRTTVRRDDLLYWIFQSVTFSMASKYEVQHRNPDEDFRKQLFTKQFELLDQLDPAWTERLKRELGSLLKDAGQ
jgi:hypothetical protein